MHQFALLEQICGSPQPDRSTGGSLRNVLYEGLERDHQQHWDAQNMPFVPNQYKFFFAIFIFC